MPSARGVATSIWWRFRQLLLHCTTSRIHAVELQTPRLVSVVRLAAHGREWRASSRPGGQWVLSFPWPLRMLFAAQAQWLSPVLGVVIWALSRALL
ncbi:MAG: hypothetical protein HOI95_20525 [Chromatiales bacterium]|nr:hypothetical protein [Chromatiales bacterium]